MNHNLKPREKFKQLGPARLSDAELLAVILQSGTKSRSVMEISQYILEKHNGLDELVNLNYQMLNEIHGVGEVKAIKLLVIGEIIKRVNQNKVYKQLNKVLSPIDIYEYTKEYKDQLQENFILLSLNTKNEILSKKVIFKGSLNMVSIHPREIMKEAILNSANQIVIVHNHPSGNLDASKEDIEVTKRLVLASRLIGIELIDHVIISNQGYNSLRKIKPKLFE